LWEECKLIELYFSIDDVGQRFDYQRSGANWDSVQKNLQWYKESMPHNHMFNINCTWGYLNLYYLNELVEWHQENFFANRYGDPTNLVFQKVLGKFSINHVSAATQDILVDRFKNYPSLIALVKSLKVVDQTDHGIFWDYVNRIDSIRGNSFKTLCPEWSDLLCK